MEGSSRQLAILQAAVKILGVGVLLPLVIVERAFHVPLLEALIRLITSDIGKQVALVYLACQIAAVAVQAVFDRALNPLLAYMAPPSLEETASKPRYLYDQALAEPETALVLVDREQARVLSFLPLYLGVADLLEGGETIRERGTVLDRAQPLTKRSAAFSPISPTPGPAARYWSRSPIDRPATAFCNRCTRPCTNSAACWPNRSNCRRSVRSPKISPRASPLS